MSCSGCQPSMSTMSSSTHVMTPAESRIIRTVTALLDPEGSVPDLASRLAESAGENPSARRAMVMISGLVSIRGCRSQSPNCSSIARPASDRNKESEPVSRNLRELRLTCGRSQPELVNVVVNETTSPSTGVSTSCAIRTTAPAAHTTSTALSGVQTSHVRTSGLRVSNAKRPSAVRADRITASEARNCSSSMNTWNAWPVMTTRSNS